MFMDVLVKSQLVRGFRAHIALRLYVNLSAIFETLLLVNCANPAMLLRLLDIRARKTQVSPNVIQAYNDVITNNC